MRFVNILIISAWAVFISNGFADDFQPNAPARNVTESEIQVLFEVAIKQVPDRISFLALQKSTKPKLKDEQIRVEAETNMRMTEDMASMSQEDRSRMKTRVMNDLRERNSGMKFTRIKEQKSFDFFRVDQFESNQESQLTNSTQFGSTRCVGIDRNGKHISWLTIYDTKSTVFDSRIKPAHGPSGLMEAYLLDPPVGFFCSLHWAMQDP